MLTNLWQSPVINITEKKQGQVESVGVSPLDRWANLG
jgi:hypothetical protein